MTLWGIDISQWQSGIDLQRVRDEGFDFVIARVGQGAGGKYKTTRDIEWIRHRDEVRRVGLILCAYWYVGNDISPDENAGLCASWMEDTSIPVILDCENGSGDVNHFHATLDAFTNRGMHVPLSYIPHWYWNSLGSPSLVGLPPLWASRYVNGSGYASTLYPGDVSDFWDGYGNNAVELLQFTSSALVAGYRVDANAFRGIREEFINVISSPFPMPPLLKLQSENTMGLDTYWNVDAVKGRAYCSFEVGNNSAVMINKHLWIAAMSLWGDIPDVFVNFLNDSGISLVPTNGSAPPHVALLVNQRHWWEAPSGSSVVTFEWDPSKATGVLSPYLVWG